MRLRGDNASHRLTDEGWRIESRLVLTPFAGLRALGRVVGIVDCQRQHLLSGKLAIATATFNPLAAALARKGFLVLT